jgi:hypothetical protein
LLVILVAALALVQRSSEAWPIVTWPVYSQLVLDTPAPTREALEVRVRTASGRVVVLRQEDLIEPSRNAIADMALAGALDRADERAYLVKLSRIAVDEPIESLEIWRVIWRVDIRAVPPIDADRPMAQQRLATFHPDEADASS